MMNTKQQIKLEVSHLTLKNMNRPPKVNRNDKMFKTKIFEWHGGSVKELRMLNMIQKCPSPNSK